LHEPRERSYLIEYGAPTSLGASASQPILNRLWKRIDFGPKSIRLDYERLLNYLLKNEKDIKETLKVGRYDMIMAACKYLLS
jgi:hypothetical protein